MRVGMCSVGIWSKLQKIHEKSTNKKKNEMKIEFCAKFNKRWAEKMYRSNQQLQKLMQKK